MRRGLPVLALLALFAPAACGDDAVTAPEAPAAAVQSDVTMDGRGTPPALPLKARTRGMMVGMEPAQDGRCPVERPMLVSYYGEGNATHMGRVTVVGTECLGGDPTNPLTLHSGEGVYSITAANGDELFVGYNETALQPEGPDSPWMLWSAQVYALGGTGRFGTAQLVEVTWNGGLNLLTFETWSTINGGVLLR